MPPITKAVEHALPHRRVPASRLPADPPIDATVVVHRGSFAHAICDACNWTGPARRAAPPVVLYSLDEDFFEGL